MESANKDISRDLKILFLGPNHGFDVILGLVPRGILAVHCEPEPKALVCALTGAHAIVDASMQIPITEDVLRHGPDLKIISTATTGSNHIEISALKRRGIVLRTLKEDKLLLKEITPAAEHSWLMLMALARNIIPAREHVSNGGWNRELFPGQMLRGKTLGLIGCGRIGSWMANYASAFGMKVFGYDPHLEKIPNNIQRRPLDEIFSRSDFISIHVHLTRETREMVTAELLATTKQGSILINTSRGDIVDEQALLTLLVCGHLGGVGLDVLKGEPEIRDHPLVELMPKMTNLIITPHCAGYSPEVVNIVCEVAAKKVIDYLKTNYLL